MTDGPDEQGSPELTARRLLAARADTRGLAEAAFEPLHGGLGNHAWRADDGRRRCFVRLGRPDARRLGVDRDSEAVLLRLASDAGLAPPLVACDPGCGLLVTGFIDGGTWTHDAAREPRNVARLGERLRVLHALAAPPGLARRSFVASADLLEAQLRAPGREIAPLRRAAQSAFARLESRSGLQIPCHDDLHHLNLVDDGSRLWLVDWEYGGAGDPAYDLASYACQHDLDADGRRHLIASSGLDRAGAATVDDAVLDAACNAFDYVQWLWYRIEAARVSPDEPHSLRADAIAARILAAG